jgi:hypothetical protein
MLLLHYLCIRLCRGLPLRCLRIRLCWLLLLLRCR